MPPPFAAARAFGHPNHSAPAGGHSFGDVAVAGTGPIQRICKLCGAGDHTQKDCTKVSGELYGISDPEYHVKRYGQANPEGYPGGKTHEWEHPMPGLATSKSYYGGAPVVGTEKETHRGGVSGAGGGISSTGSSLTAKQYSTELGKMWKGGQKEDAFKVSLADQMNSHQAYGHDMAQVGVALDATIRAWHHDGHIDDAGLERLRSFLHQSISKRLERPDLYGKK